jgi:transcriptional regulator with XRE-family HTH domain
VKTPPHVDVKILRKVAGWTIDRLITEIYKATGATYQRGTISAIESGIRGASPKALADIAAAYGIPEGAITVDYTPRATTKVGA